MVALRPRKPSTAAVARGSQPLADHRYPTRRQSSSRAHAAPTQTDNGHLPTALFDNDDALPRTTRSRTKRHATRASTAFKRAAASSRAHPPSKRQRTVRHPQHVWTKMYEGSSNSEDEDNSDGNDGSYEEVGGDYQPADDASKLDHHAMTSASSGRLVNRSLKNGQTKEASKVVADSSAKHAGKAPVIVPNWQDPRIERSIWVQIMAYAAEIVDETSDLSWLLSMCTKVGRVLGEAAAAVLYRLPIIRTEAKAQSLVETLEKSPLHTTWNYRFKVTALRLDVRHFPMSHGSRTVHTLLRLISLLPRLSDIALVHWQDAPPYRDLETNIRWSYPEALFEALLAPAEGEEYVRALKSWQWNSRMLGKNYNLGSIEGFHANPVFASLARVAFINFQTPGLHMKQKDLEDPEVIEADQIYLNSLADCIIRLPKLEHLVFEASTVVNGYLLKLLPKTIRHLELINCWDIISGEFSSYLESHGEKLESLTLHHNESLNLSFLQVLGRTCPNLKHLRMNMSFFRHLGFVTAIPMYEDLLLASEVPNWPASLELLQLENLQGAWTLEAAEMLLQSLLDSAPRLPNLRQLTIRAMLNIPWRRRSDFRKLWKKKLTDVFLRPWTEPGQDRKRDEAIQASRKEPKKRNRKSDASRRSGRIATQLSGPSSRASSAARGARRGRGRLSYQEPDTDEFDTDGAENPGNATEDSEELTDPDSKRGESQAEEVKPQQFIQGMCSVVEVMFDNGKPAEHKWMEDDFLDSAQDDDDNEWNSDVDTDEEYA